MVQQLTLSSDGVFLFTVAPAFKVPTPIFIEVEGREPGGATFAISWSQTLLTKGRFRSYIWLEHRFNKQRKQNPSKSQLAITTKIKLTEIYQKKKRLLRFVHQFSSKSVCKQSDSNSR